MAVFGYPLQIGPTCIGALNLCADRAGELTETQILDALVLAEVATVTILGAHPGSTPGELSWDLVDEGAHQLVVHQATGMVAVQLGSDVARDIVARTLRLEP